MGDLTGLIKTNGWIYASVIISEDIAKAGDTITTYVLFLIYSLCRTTLPSLSVRPAVQYKVINSRKRWILVSYGSFNVFSFCLICFMVCSWFASFGFRFGDYVIPYQLDLISVASF